MSELLTYKERLAQLRHEYEDQIPEVLNLKDRLMQLGINAVALLGGEGTLLGDLPQDVLTATAVLPDIVGDLVAAIQQAVDVITTYKDGLEI